jgi:hypothetical protein
MSLCLNLYSGSLGKSMNAVEFAMPFKVCFCRQLVLLELSAPADKRARTKSPCFLEASRNIWKHYCKALASALRFCDFPNAIKNITLIPAAGGEKNSVTSSSKNVSPDAPRCWEYAAR